MRISEKQLCVGLKPEFIAAECASCSKIGDRILQIRGKCVMVDRDLAELYKVPTKVLNQAVRRNRSSEYQPGTFVPNSKAGVWHEFSGIYQ